MVIFHSYVSLPEGNGFFTPRIVESWMFIPIHSLKIWTSVLIEDWPTGDWLTTDQPHDGGISDFVTWSLGITTNQIATPKTNMEPILNPYILGLEMFGDVWSLEFMDSIYIFCQGCTHHVLISRAPFVASRPFLSLAQLPLEFPHQSPLTVPDLILFANHVADHGFRCFQGVRLA